MGKTGATNGILAIVHLTVVLTEFQIVFDWLNAPCCKTYSYITINLIPVSLIVAGCLAVPQ